MKSQHSDHQLSLTLPIQGESVEEAEVCARIAPEWTGKIWLSEMWKDRPETILQVAENWLDLVRDPGSWEADLQILEPRVSKNDPTSHLMFELNSAIPGRPASKGLLEQIPFLGLSRLAIGKGSLKGKTIPTVTLLQTLDQTFHKPPLLDALFLLAQESDHLASTQGNSLDRRSLARFALNAAQVQLLAQRALMNHKDLLQQWMRHLSDQPATNLVAQRMRAARAILGERRNDADYAMALSLTLIGQGGINQSLNHLNDRLKAA